MKCYRCNGTAGVFMTVKPIAAKSEPADRHGAYVVCPQTGCKKGELDRDAYYASWNLNGVKA